MAKGSSSASPRSASTCRCRPTRPRPSTSRTAPACTSPRVQEQAAEGCDLVVVLGGDGTILRGAEFARRVDAPLLGVNLGHVGFLAEAERDDLDATVDHIACQRLHRRGADDPPRRRQARRRAHREQLGAQRGERREGGPRTDARDHPRGRRPPAVELGVRRCHRLDTDRLDGVRVLGRRPGRLAAGRGDPRRAERGARPLRPPPRARPRHPSSPSRSRPPTRAPGSCGATADATSTCRRAPASRCAAATGRSGSPASRPPPSPTGSSPSSTSPSRAGGAPATTSARGHHRTERLTTTPLISRVVAGRRDSTPRARRDDADGAVGGRP